MALMKDSADLLVDSVEMHARNGAAMDIHAMIGAMTVQVVGTTAFGCSSPLPTGLNPDRIACHCVWQTMTWSAMET